MPATPRSVAPLTLASTTIAVDRIGFSHDVLANLVRHSGNEYASLVAVPGANPRLTFRAHFQDAYDLLTFEATEFTTCNAYLSTYTNVARDSSSTHVKIALASSARAIGQIVSVSTDQDGVLMAECELILLSSDGTTHPSVVTNNNALPALTGQPEVHSLGPCVINGTDLPGVRGFSMTLGQQLTAIRSDGDLYPRISQRTGGEPRMTIEHADPYAVMALGLIGVDATSNIVQYFRRYNATTGVLAVANSVSLTVASGRLHPTQMDGEQGALARHGFEVISLSSSDTHPVAVSTSATSPASG